jgi:phenylacetate-coenzyme A ligase PaaK-like adenylate-forming protein
VFDIYGSTEAGPLAWQCSPCNAYHATEDAAVFEFLPVPGRDARRLVITSLELRGTPMIRYDTGDLVRPGPSGRCSCGRSLARIEHVEGRAIDCLRLPDGRALSPYYVTEELEDVEVDRFQLIQEALDMVTVRLQGARAGTATVEQHVHQLLRPIVGAGVAIQVEAVTSLEPPPGRKFRAVECRIGAEARP